MITFEHFKIGATDSFGDYLITEEEIIEFATKYDPQPFHTDPEFAKRTFHGQLIASGWMTCSVMMRMLCDNLMTNSSSIGSPGVEKLCWIRPVYVNDRLSVSVTALDVRLSKSKPGVGIVNYKVDVLNQKDELVMTLTSTGMFLTLEAVKQQTANA